MTLKQACLIAGVVLLTGCDQTPVDPGEELYLTYCVACHGADGRGTGRIAAEFPSAPADLTQLSAGNDGVFPSRRVVEKIYGYPGRYSSQIMPEFGPVLEGPTVLWTDETGAQIETPRALMELRDYLASIQTF